jgi:DNA-binding IclR family transcriptional regulator
VIMRTVDRVVAILNYLAESKLDCGITDISTHLGLSKATVYRILSSLERGGWVFKSETGRYTLSGKVLELCVSLRSNFDLAKHCIPYLKQLRDITGETAMINVRDGLTRLVVEQIEGSHALRYLAEPGRRLPLWCAAPSKAILAFAKENEIEAVINELMSSEVKTLASGQTISVEGLREELSDIRRKGFAVSIGERVPGTFGVAAPFFGHDNQVAGSISVTGPLVRFSDDAVAKYSTLIIPMAREISIRFGSLVLDSTRTRDEGGTAGRCPGVNGRT